LQLMPRTPLIVMSVRALDVGSLQVLLNIGTVISVIPVVGVTLPLISYGGSSLIATFIALGYVLGVLRRDPQIASEIRQRKAARTARG